MASEENTEETEETEIEDVSFETAMAECFEEYATVFEALADR